jgi:hypothetical protein
MKSSFLKVAGLLSVGLLAASVPGCYSGDVDDDGDLYSEELEIGQTEQALMSCSNPDGTNSVMAALAVATAQELKRWQPSLDFVGFNSNSKTENSTGNDAAIKLTATGKAQCADGKCAKVQALLDMQYSQAAGLIKFPGNVVLVPGALRTRLAAKLWEQQSCEKRPANGGTANCPVEQHKLTFQSASKGSCDTNFFFKATTPTGGALQYPAQLKNKLLWVDATNPYVAFQNVGDVISIDPTYGLNEDGASSAGTCSAACTKVTTTSVAGQCCSCNGATKSFAKSAWNAVTYLCQ